MSTLTSKSCAQCSRLRDALLDLYNGTAEYVYLNNLGDPHNTTPMRNAAEVLGVAYPRSLGAKQLRRAHETCDQHVANEWADMASNGVVWLRNICDGISTPLEALAEMESNLTRIRSLPHAPKANERLEPLGSQYDGGKAMGPGK